MMDVSLLEKSFLRKEIPDIRSGDTVRVRQNVKEGDKKRIALFEGIVIARKHGREAGATITLRKVVDGIGVERIFPLHLPSIASIEVTHRSKARRAKLYYIRERAARDVRRKIKSIWQENKASVPVTSAETKEAEKPAA